MREHQALRKPERTAIRVPYSKLQLFADLFCGAAIVGVLLFLILSWPDIPERIPMHYNFAGEVNSWGGKSSLWWLTGLMVLLCTMMKVCSFFPNTWNMPCKLTESNRERVLLATKNLLAMINVTMVLLFAYLIIASAGGEALNQWVFIPLLVLVFVPIIFYFIYVKKISRTT